MGEEAGRKSALRHAKLAILLAIILAISLTPAIAIRFFPQESARYLLDPTWSVLGTRTGLSRQTFNAIWIVVSFLLAILSGSGLLLVVARELAGSAR